MRLSSLDDWRYSLGKILYRSPFYGISLGGGAPDGLIMVPPDPWPGDAARGGPILRGEFRFADETVRGDRVAWQPVGTSDAWRTALNGFEWLKDLRAVGGDTARRRARTLISDWIERHDRWHEHSWRPDVLGRRLYAWLGQHDFFCASADDEFRKRCFASIVRQARHLSRTLSHGAAGEGRIASIKALAAAGLCVPGHQAWPQQALEALDDELTAQILPDGGHVSRNPATLMEVLRHLVDLRGVLLAAGHNVPPALHGAIERVAPMLRMMRHGDGGLALFNGSYEGHSAAIDMLLARANARGQPPASALQSGFERLVAGRTMVLVDVGEPSDHETAHAGTLSFEVSVRRERMIVNSGARSGAREPWATAQRASAAHSTLIVDDTNSTDFTESGPDRRVSRQISCGRESSVGNIWLDAAHDGYQANFGLEHRRRLYLAANGDDLRGEDILSRNGDGTLRAREFVIRFHLHPDVNATLAGDGSLAILSLPGGEKWRLRATGATMSLGETVYLGATERMMRSQQVVLGGQIVTEGETVAEVKWALGRLDDNSTVDSSL